MVMRSGNICSPSIEQTIRRVSGRCVVDSQRPADTVHTVVGAIVSLTQKCASQPQDRQEVQGLVVGTEVVHANEVVPEVRDELLV
jgi:hypothetical protein